MKKYLWLVLILSLAACGEGGGVQPGESGGTKEDKKEDKKKEEKASPAKSVSPDISGRWLLVDSQIEGIPYTDENTNKLLYLCTKTSPMIQMTVGELKSLLCQSCGKREEIYEGCKKVSNSQGKVSIGDCIGSGGTFKVLQEGVEVAKGQYNLNADAMMNWKGDWIPENEKEDWNFHYKEEFSEDKKVRKFYSRGVNECRYNAAYTGANKTGTKHAIWWIFKYCGDVNTRCQ